MEYYQVFLKVISKEMKRFNLNSEVHCTFVNQLNASLDVNFDVSYQRCAYMYKYATNCLYFFKDCINLFLLDYKDVKDLLSEWKNYSEVNVCSLSVGPGLDYLAFVLAILESDQLPPKFTGVAVISKHGAWRNTLNLLLEVFHEQGSVFEVAQPRLKFHNMRVIQADLIKCFSEKITITSLSDAHVVLMMKTLNLLAAGTNQEGPILNMLKGMIASLKSGAVIFCIDTKPSLALLSQALSNFPGKFLYGPTYRTIKLPVEFPEVEGCRPATSSRGAFFVWQKMPLFPSMTNINTTVEMTSGSRDSKSMLKAFCDSDTSFLSTSIKDEANEYDSDNVSSMELTKFWQSSSPAIKNILKKLMLSDPKTLEQIGDSDLKVEKEDIELLDRNRTELLGATVSCVFEESAHASAINLFKNSSVDSSSFETIDSLSPTEMSNSTVDNLIYENITLYNDIEKKDPVLDIIQKPNTYEVSVNSEEAVLMGNTKISPDEDKLKTTNNALNNIPSSSKISTEQINQFLNESFVSAKSDTMKSKVGLEKDNDGKSVAVISSEEEVIQSDPNEYTNSTSIQKLADRIRHLTSSLESITLQNEQPDYKLCNESPNTNNQHSFAPNSAIDNNVPSCSKHSPKYRPVEEKAFQCFHCNNRHHCCHNTCNSMPCCSRTCHSQHMPLCNFSCNTMLCEKHFNNPSPNIVIPLQNISEEALLEIVSLLKSNRESK